MRIALFAAGGEIPIHALERLVQDCTVVAVIRPRPRAGWQGTLRAVARLVLRPRTAVDELTRRIAELGIVEWPMYGPRDPSIAARLASASIDLGCVATFPWRLSDVLLAAPRLGVMNLHASLLPRHRGPSPWFWTYHSDDREVGVTAHLCESRIDRGPILTQARWALPRGHPVAALHREAAERGAGLLPQVIASAAAGTLSGVAQHDAIATRAPRVAAGASMLDPDWPAERAWHFMAGLLGQYQEPLRCDGRSVEYRHVSGFETGPTRHSPGHVERDSERGGWKLWCRDGFVRLGAAAP